MADGTPAAQQGPACPVPAPVPALASPLSEFFVFNPSLSTREDDEEKKILYYFPASTSDANKHKHIGLCEGMIHFTQPFSPTKPVQSIHTAKRAYFLSNPEPDVWAVAVLENPPLFSRPEDAAPPPTGPQTSNQPTAPGALLANVYETYRLLNGRIGGEPEAVESRRRLEVFMPSALAAIPWASADLLSALAGVHWLSLERNVYLQVHKFVNAAEHALPDVRATMIAHRDHLIWSALPQQDTRALYRLLAAALGFGAPGDALSARASPQAQAAREAQLEASDFFATLRGRLRRRARFLTGPEDPASQESPRASADVYLSSDGPKARPCGLVVYQLFDFTFAFVTARRVGELDAEFFRVLDRHVEAQFTEQFLASIVYDHHQRMSAFDEQYRYVYYNHMNLALKTSLLRNTDVSPATMDLIDSMHADFEDSTDGVCELLVRTNSDKWVVGRRSEQREFYIIFDNSKSANLSDINEEVKKLSAQYFANIFITE
eukprot:m51a1_g662 hypothetical protein (491) ;mRNA; r:233445-235733